MARRPQAPGDLGDRGRQLWRDVTGSYELEAHELRLLAEACRTVGRIEELGDAVEADGVMVAGSQGQQVLHPAVTEQRQQRQLLSRLVAQLDLEDDDGGQTVPSPASLRARHAANVRWQGRGRPAGARS